MSKIVLSGLVISLKPREDFNSYSSFPESVKSHDLILMFMCVFINESPFNTGNNLELIQLIIDDMIGFMEISRPDVLFMLSRQAKIKMEYHHYIPRFLLKKYAVDNYEKNMMYIYSKELNKMEKCKN